MKSSHCPKYERKNLKNSALSIQGKNFQIFRPYFGQCDDLSLSILSIYSKNAQSTSDTYTAMKRHGDL